MPSGGRGGARSPVAGAAAGAAAGAVAGAVGLAIYAFYALVYPLRGVRVPLGFDTTWYVWRAQFVATLGIGPAGTNSRPGAAVLAALVGALVRRSQLEVAVVLSLVLVSAFALATGAATRRLFGRDRWGWVVAAAVTGVLLGTTRMVSENVATLVALLLTVAAVVPLAGRIEGRASPRWTAVALLLAAGVAHWLFLAVFGAMFAVAWALALPSSARAVRDGARPLDTEAGVLATVWGIAAAALATVVFAALRAPWNTIGVQDDPSRLLPKLRHDVTSARLPFTGPLALLGAVSLAWPLRAGGRHREAPAVAGGRASGIELVAPAATGAAAAAARRFGLRLLAGWTLVAAAGIGYGLVTRRLPPHRFFDLFVAVPLALALAEAAALAARATGARAGRVAGVLVAALAVAALAVPGALVWYGERPQVWTDPAMLRESETAAAYLQAAGIPDGRPVVVVAAPRGTAGVESIPLKERIIRVGIPPGREASLYLFFGTPTDLLARRRVPVSPAIDRATLPYWQALQPVLGMRPVVLVLREAGPKGFEEALRLGGRVVGPGVAVLPGRGLAVPAAGPVAAPPLPASVPGPAGLLVLGAALLALLGLVGLGWAALAAGPGAAPEEVAALAPAAGVGALILAGTPVALFGVGLGGAAGVGVIVGVAAVGWAAAARARRHVGQAVPAEAPRAGTTSAGRPNSGA